MCRKSAAELAQIQPALEKLDIRTVAIGTGNIKSIVPFKEDTKFNSDIFIDPSANIYKFFACKRGVRAGLLNGKTLDAIKNAWTEGYRMKVFDGKLFQLGGTFVLYNGEIIYEHHEKFAGDHVDLEEVLSACGLPEEMIEQINLVTPAERLASDKEKQKERKDWLAEKKEKRSGKKKK
jgi:hypothetical protein